MSSAAAVKKSWIRRSAPDQSQAIRRGVQFAFLALNLWIGVEFFAFVRQFEAGGVYRGVVRPPGVEGWLPIAGLMNLRLFVLTGSVPAIHPAAMVLTAAFLFLSLLLRKAFCGWLCPVGTLSEHLWKLGRRLLGRVFWPPRAVDVVLRALKYVLAGLFLYAVASMPASGLRGFLESPYGLIADVKMLNFFRGIGSTGVAVLGLLVAGSVLLPNFWCRYLCPYGALMGLAALASPLRIRRSPAACIDCAKCAKACPSALPVDRLVQIRSAECLGCMECVAACPAAGALELRVAGIRRGVSPLAVAAVVAALLLVCVSAAKGTGHWASPISPRAYSELIPRAAQFGHP